MSGTALATTPNDIRTHHETDVLYMKVAREIACDLRPIDDILSMHDVTREEWEEMQNSTLFRAYLKSAVQDWESATNTAERVKVKAMSFIEEALPEFFGRAHDPKESLAAKVEVLKTVAKMAGVSENSVASSTGERMSVVINLGNDHQLKIEKNITPTIEAEDD